MLSEIGIMQLSGDITQVVAFFYERVYAAIWQKNKGGIVNVDN